MRIASFAVLGGVLVGSAAVRADFQSALKDYNAGRYETAHAQFLSLAELGDCSSQFNLGAMALKGQGGPKDIASGVGWLQAAAGNGWIDGAAVALEHVTAIKRAGADVILTYLAGELAEALA